MYRKLWIHCAGLIWLLHSTLAFTADRSILSSARLTIPYGNSIWEQVLYPTQPLKPLQIAYVQTAACPFLAVSLALQDASSGQWLNAVYHSGWFYMPPGLYAARALRVNFTQTSYAYLTCDISVISNPPVVTVPIPSVGEYLEE